MRLILTQVPRYTSTLIHRVGVHSKNGLNRMLPKGVNFTEEEFDDMVETLRHSEPTNYLHLTTQQDFIYYLEVLRYDRHYDISR